MNTSLHQEQALEKYDILVIIPTFRRKSLIDTVRSAYEQPQVSKKVIVVDDCPEGSARFLQAEFPNLLYLKNPEPSGGWPARVRNYGIIEAVRRGIKSDFIHFLDDDDLVPANYYHDICSRFVSNKKVGVIFGVMRPFCRFAQDKDIRDLQGRQLEEIKKWRKKVTRYAFIYQNIGDLLRSGLLSQWLLSQHSIFGPEMFLCSGAIIRYEHVIELGGFPDIRITEDFNFFTKAIRKYGGHFIMQESAGYGTGASDSMWNHLRVETEHDHARTAEINTILTERQKAIKVELGHFEFYARKILYKIEQNITNFIIFPICEELKIFRRLEKLIDGDSTRAGATGHAPRPPPF